MKGKLPKIVMVFVALAMVFSMAGAFATSTVIAQPGVNSFSRMALPSTADYQMLPDSDIWDITIADDGTVFAIVEDTSSMRWSPKNSDFAVMKTLDGGYSWDLIWYIPANEPTSGHASGVPVEIVPQPGYDDEDADNQIVFLATDDNLYRSKDGGDAFTRIVPERPGVVDPDTAQQYGLISSIDVAENINVENTYVAVVGIANDSGGGEGVFTWNEDNLLSWRDKKAGNTVKGNGYEALDVMFSPNYFDDGVIIAILNDNWNQGDVIVSFWVTEDGLWNGPTLADGLFNMGTVPDPWQMDPAAGMAFGLDFDIDSHPWFFAFVNDWGNSGEVYAIKALPTSTGPSVVIPRQATAFGPFSDITFEGLTYDSESICFVGSATDNVIEGSNLTLFATWTPAIKSLSGSYPIWLDSIADDNDFAVLAAAGTEGGSTTSGVSIRVEGPKGSVYNGIGLLDDITVTTDHVDGNIYYATMASIEASPNYKQDETLYMAIASEWYEFNNNMGYTLSLWRQGPTGLQYWPIHGAQNAEWERVLQEGMMRFGRVPGGKTAIVNPDIFSGIPPTFVTLPEMTWIPKCDPDFANSNYMFLLCGENGVDRLWYSLDRGNTWDPTSLMPASPGILSETGWDVVDSSTILLGDSQGWVYRTDNRGNSWTDGAFTNTGLVTDLNAAPSFSDSDDVVAGIAYHGSNNYGLYDMRIDNEVWLSQDGADRDFTLVADELMITPGWDVGVMADDLLCMANFDMNWEDNNIIYATASGAMDEWIVNPISGIAELQNAEEVGLYRTEINLVDTQASTWELLVGADDIVAAAPTPSDDCIRYLILSDLSIGPEDGTIYIPMALYHDDSVGTISPNTIGRFTMGGMARCLDGAETNPDINLETNLLGPYDGLWMMPVATGSNYAFSTAFDVWDWRFKMVGYMDTLSSGGSANNEPADGAENVGTLVGTSVNVQFTWEAIAGATQYELQVSRDSAFTSPESAITSETSAQIPGLEPGSTYFWRVRSSKPATGSWCCGDEFSTVTAWGAVAPELLTPSNGETGVASKPTFSWTSIPGTSQYTIEVSSEADIANTVIVETVTGTAYEAEEDLSGSNFWRVKGKGDWSDISTFTVGGEGTPAWVWVLIVVGIILAIVVIVLILRTRRPA